MKKKFIDINKRLPKLGELVIVKLKDGSTKEMYRSGCIDKLPLGWIDPTKGIIEDLDVVGWQYKNTLPLYMKIIRVILFIITLSFGIKFMLKGSSSWYFLGFIIPYILLEILPQPKR
jgi:hypothetical protein